MNGEEVVSSYYFTARKRDGTGNWKEGLDRSVDNSLSKKLLFCRKIDYAVNVRVLVNECNSQLDAISIQLLVFHHLR
jgi:hypothetical protein